jgi:hypothetical protein
VRPSVIWYYTHLQDATLAGLGALKEEASHDLFDSTTFTFLLNADDQPLKIESL